MQSVKRAFISHARENTSFAEGLAVHLRGAGLEVWLDASHMGSGNFVDRISNAINGCDVLILVLSPEALASRWVPEEMNAAIVRYKQGFMRAPIVIEAEPVSLRDIPALWTAYNRIDATANYSEARHQLLRALDVSVLSSVLPPRVAPRPSLPSPIGSTLDAPAPALHATITQSGTPPHPRGRLPRATRRAGTWTLAGAWLLINHWRTTVIALLIIMIAGIAVMKLLVGVSQFRSPDAVMAVVCDAYTTHNYDALIARIDPTFTDHFATARSVLDSNVKTLVKGELTNADSGYGTASSCSYSEIGESPWTEATASGPWTGEVKTFNIPVQRSGTNQPIIPLTVYLIKESNGQWYIARDSDFGAPR